MPRAFVSYGLVHYHPHQRRLTVKWCKSVIAIPQNRYNCVISARLTIPSVSSESYRIRGLQLGRGRGKRSIRAEVSGPA